jgi:hypothetical protein
MEGGGGERFSYNFVRVRSRSRHQEIVFSRDNAFRNGGDLLGRFALAEDNFRKALPYAAVVVDARETDVFEG